MKLRIDGAFDIETQEWDTFVCGGLNHGAAYTEAWDPDDLYDAIVGCPDGSQLWTWNGGHFDTLWALDMAVKRREKVQLNAAGTRVTRASFGGVTIRDAVALVPMSLAKAADIAGAPKLDTSLPCSCASPCGGYCAIRIDMPAAHRDRLSRYLRRDVELVVSIMDAVATEFERCDYDLRGTLGGSAWATARRQLEIEDAEWHAWRDYRMARRGYFGGRTEVYRPRAASGWRYDIHSAYPAALQTTPLPVGDYSPVGESMARKCYRAEKEGIYLADVEVPEMHVPPLPYRTRCGRVLYPVGRWNGAWTRIELEYAESVGARVDIRGGLVWARSEVVFEEFMATGWANRERVGTGSALGKLHKLFLNSLTGKLAERPDKMGYVICPEMDEPRRCDGGADSYCTSDRCNGSCGSWTQLSEFVWGRPTSRIPSNGYVQWAAYLTAAARVELHKQLVADGCGGRTAVYCDTDSCYATREREHRIGPSLGWWGLDGRFRDFYALAPKVYRFIDEHGEPHSRAKGLPYPSDAEWRAFADGGTVTRDRGVKGFKSAARGGGGLFERRSLSRTNRSDGIWYGGRKLQPDGSTRPPSATEARTWHVTRK